MSVSSMPGRPRFLDQEPQTLLPEGGHWPPFSSSPTSLTLVQDTPEKAARNHPNVDVFDGSPLSPPPETPSRQSKKAATRASSKPQKFNDVLEHDEWLDENADDSFTGSFGSPDVLLIGEDDDRSGSPEIGTPEFFTSVRKARTQPEMESPAKKRKLSSLKFKSKSKTAERSLSPEL